MKKTLLNLLLSLIFCLLITPLLTISISAESTTKYVGGHSVLLPDGVSLPQGTNNNTDVTSISYSTSGWGSASGQTSWYIAEGDVNIDKTVTVTGDVHLILADGCTLSVSGSSSSAIIKIKSGNSLTIYSQSDGNNKGSLVVTNNNDAAVIGDYYSDDLGNMIVNGGCIETNGGDSNCGSICVKNFTLNDGTVKTKNKYGIGIYAYKGTFTVNGGEIDLTESSDSIFGSEIVVNDGKINIFSFNTKIKMNISGGEINADSFYNAQFPIVNISGGTINLNCTENQYGILGSEINISEANTKKPTVINASGSGLTTCFYATKSITVTGGKINANSNDAAFYIASDSNDVNLNITGGEINAIATDKESFGIYAKTDSSYVTKINITGGTVNAEGGYTGICADCSDDCGDSTINISGAKATVNAKGNTSLGIFAKYINISNGFINSYGKVYGMISQSGTEITGGTIYAKATDLNALDSSSGIYVFKSNENDKNIFVTDLSNGEDKYTASSTNKENIILSLSGIKNVRIGPAVCYVDSNNNGKQEVSEKTYGSIQTAINDNSNKKSIVLISDDIENVYIPSGKNITLDLNGYVLKAGPGKDIEESTGNISKNNSAILVRGDLTLIDSGTNTPHYYKYSKTSAWLLYDEATSAEKNSAKTLDEIDETTTDGTIIKVLGGVITGGKSSEIFFAKNESTFGGAGVFVIGWKDNDSSNYSVGNFILKGGNIIGNKSDSIDKNQVANGIGGGVFSDASYVSITGGNILGNFVNASGGGIACFSENDIDNKGRFTMSGGTIAYNVAKYGGGLFAYGIDKATVGGTTKIYGNTASEGNNYYVIKTSPFDLGTSTNGKDGNGVLKPAYGMSVGVTLADDVGPTTGAFTTNGNILDKQYFFSDIDDYYVKYIKAVGEEGQPDYVAAHLELEFESLTTVKIDKNIKNGKIIVDNQEAIENATVTIIPIPNNGYVLDKITVKDKDNAIITVNKDNTFAMPSSSGKLPVTVSATFKKTGGYVVVNTGVKANNNYLKAISLISTLGLTTAIILKKKKH